MFINWPDPDVQSVVFEDYNSQTATHLDLTSPLVTLTPDHENSSKSNYLLNHPPSPKLSIPSYGSST
ncbi:hypothetical protein L1987_78604 [Smallanthus sonchifolius]|uniref:Uncharacterized protein n=1 Tax=Smallanthus sonchifolius TaxID=185202 RepID=A0ACB8ZE65_9ASTR|nr:hypothetical protein L1987_78604 [Smallanthus sonchifolius]